MPKNKGKGGKNYRRGKNDTSNTDKRELVFKDECQVYAQVTKVLGNGRMEVQCTDDTKRLAHIRGSMRKKVWINLGDYVLVSLREYQDDKCDIILKYTDDEVASLRQAGQLPERVAAADVQQDEDELVDFEVDIDAI
ncbi:Translation initiation factor 1A [Coemansia nantahalensis]|uniref:Translation initiation factor 1A n=1 Tax=Coemansia nantahalensis TaxID=2789366 RepID=A0ACC1JM80_9FUNG|nr:Translation initiation factor 1A [Coemansia nantahalensis]